MGNIVIPEAALDQFLQSLLAGVTKENEGLKAEFRARLNAHEATFRAQLEVALERRLREAEEKIERKMRAVEEEIERKRRAVEEEIECKLRAAEEEIAHALAERHRKLNSAEAAEPGSRATIAVKEAVSLDDQAEGH
jgi:hypothetical protein